MLFHPVPPFDEPAGTVPAGLLILTPDYESTVEASRPVRTAQGETAFRRAAHLP
jgi:hypothetical protein